MLRVLRYMMIMVSVFALAYAGACTELVDDFNDGKMNEGLWSTFIDGIGPVAVETFGYVEVTLPEDAREAEAPHSFGGGFKSVKCLRGDFDIQIDYYLLEWPSGSGVRVGLGLFPPRSSQMGNVQRSSFGPAEGGPTESYAVDYQTGGGGVPTNHTCGSLRLARVGNKLTAGVLVDGNWVELYTSEFSTENYHFAFTAWSHDAMFADKEVRVAFDNFIMHYGELVDPSAPPATSTVRKETQASVSRPGGQVIPIAPSLRGSQVINMPYGKPFLRMPRLSTSVPSKCGPYNRIRIALPPQKSALKPPRSANPTRR